MRRENKFFINIILLEFNEDFLMTLKLCEKIIYDII